MGIEAVEASGGVRRSAFYLPSQGEGLFALLHTGESAGERGGVVVCPPVGHEQVHAHRALRRLADELARAGLAVLRFDYHGTGDSPGGDEDPDRVATWLANVRDALGWLRSRLPGKPVSLFGLRLGASLALRASGEEEVDRLALWAPAAGRSFAREMKALALTAAAPSLHTSGELETAGFVYTPQTMEALAGLDPLRCVVRCRRVLIAARDVGGDQRLHDHLTAQGCAVDRFDLAGYADMMAEPHYTRLPQEAIERTVGWLAGTGEEGTENGKEGKGKATGSEPLVPVPGSVPLPSPGGRETPVTLSVEPHLFGILSEPADRTADLPMVVLLNAGSVHRVGPGRLYVHIARRLAAAGFSCLRLDLSGLGDSVFGDARGENDPYASTAFRDVAKVLERLQAEHGVRRVVLMGLCSGAYTAFHSAIELNSPVLVESVLINPLTFYWKDGMKLGEAAVVRQEAFRYYLTSALEAGRWWKLLSGRTRIGLLGGARLLLEHWRQRWAARAGGKEPGELLPGHPPEGNLGTALRRVAGQGRRLTLVFARSDPGYGLLTFHAAGTVWRLRRAGKVDLFFIEDADHTFSGRAARGRLIETVAAHLHGRYGAGMPEAEQVLS